MASDVPLQMFDDDDDFDWDAAVREIDAACDHETTNQSSASAAATTTSAAPFRNSNLQMGSCPKTENNKPSSSRQSTLDKFIGFTGSKSVTQDTKYDAQDKDLCNDERTSSISIDPEAAKTWIYPENVPVRDYQVSITRTALFSNTLVSLPTGLGKTLIAAVVMYNYHRWFPEGKIVFAAPSRPLVMQQIEACHNIVGIPQDLTVDMTGQTSPSQRAGLWKTKQVFFVTPQVLEKDIQSGSCMVKKLVCLVIDEAHRASGNYSYCVVVRELMAVPVQLRILALTATPGSNQPAVQQVIDNLQISSLEHRSESDPDVIQYVHDRKIEIIEVEMGKDAAEANNLLLHLLRTYVGKLSNMKVFQMRDAQSLSAVEFLKARDKFRQFPPPELDQVRYGEVETIFGALLTLVHIRKLLYAHGTGPAYEALVDKSKQGAFARLFSRNETLEKARVIMKHNMEHGALSPKFTKMLEVLVDHFKNHDPQKSRVIIFSNYRDSVRGIMSSLTTIGEYVKATEFIGQSTGKTSKGQSQKAQQAVLKKFRAGGYNTIVATSIGEEGLDIMEVDLVICFDANISPLRMIQRMGRTGRKSKGRVVVLACEGSEAKGYRQKQASGKAVKKHMVNGGTHSFRFHSSPRMVPHIYRPEKKLEKIFIEEFVPRGKKVKDDENIQTPKYKLNLTDIETDLLAKYFHPSSENIWRPSLIAFPHFLVFPSRVHAVAHSMRTGMLIDTMQYLQGINTQDEENSEECFGVEPIEHRDNTIIEDTDDVIRKEPENEALSPMDTSTTEEKHNFPDTRAQNPPIHTFLFGSEFTSVDSLGRVLILSVPLFPRRQVSQPKSQSQRSHRFSNCLESDSSHVKASCEEHPEIVIGINGYSNILGKSEGSDDIVRPCMRNLVDLQEEDLDGDEEEVIDLDVSKSEVNITEIPSSDDDLSTDFKTGDLSPRLTNLIMSGVVPESPVNNGTSSKVEGYCISSDHDMPPNTSISLAQNKNDEESKECTPNRRNSAGFFIPEEIHTPRISLQKIPPATCVSDSKFVGEIRTPLTNLSNNSCSKDWILSSGEKSVSEPKRKLKRLRKYGEIKSENLLDVEEVVGHSETCGRSRTRDKHGRGDAKLINDARVFIDDEAEVSLEDSGDEDVDHGQDSYDGSFIDDRLNPTMAITQSEPPDMMAIYRRSLLSQSPITGAPNFSLNISPDNITPTDQTHSTSLMTKTTNQSLYTSNTSTNGNSSSIHLNTNTVIPTTTNETYKTNETRKRKLGFCQSGSLPIRNLEPEMSLEPEATNKESVACKMDGENEDIFDDDDFYEGIDFDALEEQATKQLRSKSLEMNKKQNEPNLEFLGSPSFDLGI